MLNCKCGCGKTTMAKCIVGLEDKSAGRITFDGQDIITYIFIGHNLSVIRHFCNQIMVVYVGRICEVGTTFYFLMIRRTGDINTVQKHIKYFNISISEITIIAKTYWKIRLAE
ncbi:hypothetical protein ES703_89713 [subsurface metagenome]